MRFICFIFYLIFPFAAFGSLFQEQFNQAQPGDWVALSHQKCVTLLLVREKEGPYLLLEEITLPEIEAKKHLGNWKDWLDAKAQGQLGWLVYRLHLDDGKISKAYSRIRGCWIEFPENESFLSTLMRLDFSLVEEKERRKVGHCPPPDSPDRRPLWQPPLFVNGKQVRPVQFDAWKTLWPKDGTELSGKQVEVYFPKQAQQAPKYFPFWIQVYGNAGSVRLRVVDSGKGLFPKHSPYPLN